MMLITAIVVPSRVRVVRRALALFGVQGLTQARIFLEIGATTRVEVYRGAREVVFLDPTFNHRPDFESLLDALAAVNADRSLSFFAEVRAEGLTPHLVHKLAAAGFTRVEIGLQ